MSANAPNRPRVAAGDFGVRSVFDGSRDPLVVNLGDAEVRVQLCLSPHCTTIASILESSDGWWPAPARGWGGLVARHASELDLAALAPYRECDRFPVFLGSALTEPAPTFESQVADVRSTPADQVRRDVIELFPDAVPPAYQPFLDDPRAALDRLADAMLAYWRRVVEPSWPAMRSFLDREILRQGYALATRGGFGSLTDVHPSLSVEGRALHIRSPLMPPCSTSLDGRGLMLTPLISDRPAILADLAGATHVKIGYAAPGVEEVWASPESAAASDQLGELLGDSRARVVRALQTRSTTSTLSRELNLAPATVSSHLSALARLSLVERTRLGRSVYYRLGERGEALLDLFQAGDLSPLRSTNP